jgi:predicted Zn finger-like uncharacterized protein
MAFITRCPHCETSFNITESQLQKAQGLVRCGFCLQTFSALEHQLYLEEEIDLGDIELGHVSAEAGIEEILHENYQYDAAYFENTEDDYADAVDLPEDVGNSQIPTLEAANEAFEESVFEETDSSEIKADALNTFSDEEDEPEIAEDTGDLPEEMEAEERIEIADVIGHENQEEAFKPGEAERYHEEDDDETHYDTKPTEHEDEEEYSLDEDMPEFEPMLGPRVNAGASPGQKSELQSLASLYDDSPLERLNDSNLDSLSDEPIAIHQPGEQCRLIKTLLIACNILLLLGLGAQYFWQQIDRFLLDERFTPLTSLLCQAVECPQATRFDLNQFSTEELIVNAHPQLENALQVDFIFRNNAGYSQAFPRVELNFTDINRRLLANRLFEPQEYLDPELQQFEVLPAGASVQIKLEIADPGPAAINYTLALRTPVLSQPYSSR